MDRIDVAKSYRLTSGEKVKSIKRSGSVACWDNRGGDKAFYEIVLEDGTERSEWYYHTGKRTGEREPDWDHPDNLVTEERYQYSIIRMVCNCGVTEVALTSNYGQGMLRMMERLPCRECGCMRVPEEDVPTAIDPAESELDTVEFEENEPGFVI